MKAVLKFDLDDFDDRQAHLRCIKSSDMASAFFEIMHNVKKRCINKCDQMSSDSDQYDGVDLVFSEILKITDEYGIDTKDLVA